MIQTFLECCRARERKGREKNPFLSSLQCTEDKYTLNWRELCADALLMSSHQGHCYIKWGGMVDESPNSFFLATFNKQWSINYISTFLNSALLLRQNWTQMHEFVDDECRISSILITVEACWTDTARSQPPLPPWESHVWAGGYRPDKVGPNEVCPPSLSELRTFHSYAAPLINWLAVSGMVLADTYIHLHINVPDNGV